MLTAEDAQHFGCTAEVGAARDILARGTSADRQRAVFNAALAAGVLRKAALEQVVDHLIAETVEGV